MGEEKGADYMIKNLVSDAVHMMNGTSSLKCIFVFVRSTDHDTGSLYRAQQEQSGRTLGALHPASSMKFPGIYCHTDTKPGPLALGHE